MLLPIPLSSPSPAPAASSPCTALSPIAATSSSCRHAQAPQFGATSLPTSPPTPTTASTTSSHQQGRCCTSPSGQQFPAPCLSLSARRHELAWTRERTTTSSTATSGTSSTTSSSRQHARGRTSSSPTPVYGRMFAHIEAILPGQAFPPNGVNDWTLLRHEDAPSGEEGCHTSNGGPPT